MNKNNDALRVLDWFEILDFIKGFATSQLGEQRIKGLTPFTHSNEALDHLQKIEAIKTHFRKFLDSSLLFFRPTMRSLDTYSRWAESLEKRKALSSLELVMVKDFLEEAKHLKSWLSSSGDSFLKETKEKILKTSDLISIIDQLITEKGAVRVDASPLLYDLYIRKNNRIKEIQRLLNQFIRNHNVQSLLQDQFVTTREGRWVLPIKSGMKTYFNGVIHARSQTNRTFFMEPKEVLDLNNEVQKIQQEMNEEIESLFKKITHQLFSFRSDFKKMRDILLEYDLFISFATSSILLKTNEFKFDKMFDLLSLKPVSLALSALKKRCSFNIKNSYNYGQWIENFEINQFFGQKTQNKYVESMTDGVVSNDFEMDQNKRVLLLSGANAGGKTVFLKAIGCAALMAKCGLPILAAKGSRIPFFKNVRILIHDLQSVEDQTSRFSSHLVELSRLTELRGLDELFLIDEICASTDPEEGSALGRSFIESYAEQGVYAIVISHLGSLQEGWSAELGIFNGSFEFYPDTGSSYKFLPFQSGRSFALELAEKIGVQSKILKRAKSFLNPLHKAYLKEYKKNKTHYDDVKKLKKTWQFEIKKANKKIQECEKLQKKFEDEKEKKLFQILEKKEKEIGALIFEAKKEKVHLRVENLKKLKKSLPDIIKVKKKENGFFPQSIEEFKSRFPPGSLVYVPSLRSEATVQEEPNRKGEVTVLSNSLRLSLSWKDLGVHPDTFFKKPSPLSRYMGQISGEKAFKNSMKKSSLSSDISSIRKRDFPHSSDLTRLFKKNKKSQISKKKNKKHF